MLRHVGTGLLWRASLVSAETPCGQPQARQPRVLQRGRPPLVRARHWTRQASAMGSLSRVSGFMRYVGYRVTYHWLIAFSVSESGVGERGCGVGCTMEAPQEHDWPRLHGEFRCRVRSAKATLPPRGLDGGIQWRSWSASNPYGGLPLFRTSPSISSMRTGRLGSLKLRFGAGSRLCLMSGGTCL